MDQLLTKAPTPEVNTSPKSVPARYRAYRFRKIKPQRCSCGMWVVHPNAEQHRLGELHKIAREVERLNKKNLTRQQIARKLGTNHDKVVSILKRLKRPVAGS